MTNVEYEIVNAADANWEEHPDAGIFGMLEGKEYEQFRDGIKEAGIITDPIDIVKGLSGSWLLADGRNRGPWLLADGRNRRKVAREVSLPLKVNRLPDRTDVKAHVISKNLHRRHLKPSQLDWFAANIVTVRRGDLRGNQYTRGDGIGNDADTKPRTIAEAAAITGRSERTIQEFITVKDNNPEAFEAMGKGELPTGTAGKQTREKLASEGKRKPSSAKKKAKSKQGVRGLAPTTANFAIAFKPALTVFGNAPNFQLKKDMMKKLAAELLGPNDFIKFAGEEFRAPPVSMFGNGAPEPNPLMKVNKPKFSEPAEKTKEEKRARDLPDFRTRPLPSRIPFECDPAFPA